MTLLLVALVGLASVGVGAGTIPVCILFPQDTVSYRTIAAAAALGIRHGVARSNVVSADYVANLPTNMPALVPLQVPIVDAEILNTTSSAQKCVQQGGVAIIGPGSSATAHAVASSGQALGIAQVDFWASASYLSDPTYYKYLSRSYPSDATFAAKFIELCHKWNWRKIAVIHRNNAWGNGLRDDTRKAASGAGVEVLALEVSYSAPDAATVKTGLKSLKDQGVRVFVVAHSNKVADVLMTAADGAGIIGEGYAWITTDTWRSADLRSNAATSERISRSGMIRLRPKSTATNAAYAALETQLKSASASDVNLTVSAAAAVVGAGVTWSQLHPVVAYAYDAAMLAVIGIAKAHEQGIILSQSTANFAAQVHGFILASANATSGKSIKSASGNVSLDADGDRVGVPFIMDQWKAGAGNVYEWTTVSRAEETYVAGMADNETLTWAGGQKTPPIDPAMCKDGYVYDPLRLNCGLKLAIVVPHTRSVEFLEVAAVAQLAVHHVNTLDPTIMGADVVAQLSASSGPRVYFKSELLDSKYVAATALNTVVGSLKTDDIAGIIGAGRSAASQPIANLGAAEGIPQISYWSTSGELSDKSSYPYFSRTIPSDNTIVLPLLMLFRHLNVFNIGVLYIGDAYGTSLLNYLREAALQYRWADNKPFRIVGEASFEFNDYEAAENGLRTLKNAGIRVFYVICLIGDVEHIMESAEKLGLIQQGYQFVFPDSLQDRTILSAKNSTAVSRRLMGAISAKPIGFSDPNLKAGSKGYALHNAYRSAAADPVLGPRVFPSGANLTAHANLTGQLYDVCGYVYDAVIMMALAAKRVMTKNSTTFNKMAKGISWANAIRESLTGWNGTHEVSLPDGKVNFTGVSGYVVMDKHGERADLPILLHQVQEKSLDFVGTVKAVTDEKKIISGNVTLNRKLVFLGNTTKVVDGFSCGPGFMFDLLGCKPCQPGKFMNSSTNRCEDCPAGTFSPYPAALRCTPCRSLGNSLKLWQNETGASSCKTCPAGTSRPGNKPGLSISECVCDPGTYQPDLASNGSVCLPCVKGGTCAGADLDNTVNRKPYPAQGFWGDRAHPTSFLECSLAELQCKGGETFECTEGYEGILCHACAKDYYLQVGQCVKCLENSTAQLFLMIFTTVCIFALWFGMNKFTAGQYDPADIGLQFMVWLFDYDSVPRVTRNLSFSRFLYTAFLYPKY